MIGYKVIFDMMFYLEVENSWKNMSVLEEVCENNDQHQKGLLGEGRGGAYLPVFNISMFFFFLQGCVVLWPLLLYFTFSWMMKSDMCLSHLHLSLSCLQFSVWEDQLFPC